MSSDKLDVDATRALETAGELLELARGREWRGPDPYDGLWWHWPRALVGGRRRRQAIMQVHARAPFDVRRLYRRHTHPLIPKALGIFGSTAVRLGQAKPASPFLEAGREALALLDGDRTCGPVAWGYHWDMQTRWSFYGAGMSNIVVTAFAATGLDEAASAWNVDSWRERARAAGDWVLDQLYVEGEQGFVYHPGSQTLIHNANLLGAALSLRLRGDDAAVRRRVSSALERTLECQRTDGSWPYGEGAGLGFVDSFHTGYVLGCLCELADLDPRVHDAIRRGSDYWHTRFFDERGAARLWPTRRYPEDAHSAGTGLTTLAALTRRGFVDRELLRRVLRHTLAHVVRPNGAIWRRYRLGPAPVRYMRWCDAHVALGLANAALVLATPADDTGAGARAQEAGAG